MRPIFVLLAITIGTCCHQARAGWLATGPFGGDAEFVRVVPGQTGLVVAATRNGLFYESHDSGASWKHLHFPAQLAGTLHALEIDPRFPGTWYAGVESDNSALSGAFKTEDGGKSWKPLAGLKGMAVWSLVIWPALPDVVAAGTGSGVFISRDAGASWQRISPESSQDMRPVVSLAFHPTDQKIIYAGTTHLPWRTRDGGIHWESIHTGMIDDSDIFSIAVDAGSPASVFASACSGVYHSVNGGNSWARMPTPPGAFRAYLVAPDPRRGGAVFAATSTGLLRSSNGGLKWSRVSPHAVKSISFDPLNADKIYFASSTGGILVSRDGGNTLSESNAGFSNHNFSAISGSGGVLYANAVYAPGGGIFRTGDLGRNWRQMAGPGGGDALLLAVAPDDPDCLYAAGRRTLFRSGDGAGSWVRLTVPPGNWQITALLPLSRETLLVGTSAGLFRQSRNSWVAVQLPGGRQAVERLQSSGGSLSAALTAGGAFRSQDGGASWVACGQPVPNTAWYGLAMDSRNPGQALAATAHGLFRSTDGCLTWNQVRGGLEQATVTAVVFQPSRPGEALASQFGRIFRSEDGGQSWHPLERETRSEGFPAAMLVLPAAPQYLFALFPRRGVLSTSLESDQLNPTGGY